MIVSNPNSTKEIELDGAKFTVGVIPYGKRIELESMSLGNENAEKKESYRSIILQNLEFIRWGVKNHSGLLFADGSEVPFTSKKELIGTREYVVVSDELMDIYGSTTTLLVKLSKAVTEFNYLGDNAIKN